MGNETSKPDPTQKGEVRTGTVPGKKLDHSPYPIDRKGLFVIIVNTEFGYEFRHGKGKNDVWRENKGRNELMKAAHKADVETLNQIFHLNKQFPSGNVKWIEDATNDPTSSKHFDEVIRKKVLEYEGEPSFIMLFLFSHGMPEGDFLLANSEDKSCNGNQCGSGEHRQQGWCASRNVRKHIIDKIEGSGKFQRIPKIYFIHTCRGSEVATQATPMMKYKDSGGVPFKNILHDAYGSDTLVIYPCIENHPAYFTKDGSIIVRKLKEATEILNRKQTDSERFLQKTTELWRKSMAQTDPSVELADLNSLLKASGYSELQVDVRTISASWIDDVCVLVSAMVANVLRTKDEYEKYDAAPDVKVGSEAKEISQPEIVSTLRRKLSWIELVKSAQL